MAHTRFWAGKYLVKLTKNEWQKEVITFWAESLRRINWQMEHIQAKSKKPARIVAKQLVPECSIAGTAITVNLKNKFCVKAHYETLKQEGYTVEQLRDIGRIAAVITSVSRVLAS